MALPEDELSGHSQETSGFRVDLRHAEVQLMCRIPTWGWTLLGVRQSHFGVTSM